MKLYDKKIVEGLNFYFSNCISLCSLQKNEIKSILERLEVGRKKY